MYIKFTGVCLESYLVNDKHEAVLSFIIQNWVKHEVATISLDKSSKKEQ